MRRSVWRGRRTRWETDGSFFVSAKVYDVYRETTAKPEPADEEHLVLSVTLYRLLSGILGFAPPWGVLYGVRPAKLMHRLCAQMGDDAAVAHCLFDPKKQGGVGP